MNKVILMGRLTRNPEIRYTSGENPLAVARYTLAVDRRFKKNNESTADFIRCIAFGHAGEFAEKYLYQGTKVVISGRIQTGSYTNKDGIKVYTTDVVIEEQEFAESKGASQQNNQNAPYPDPAVAASMPGYSDPYTSSDGFMNIPDGLEDELPF